MLKQTPATPGIADSQFGHWKLAGTLSLTAVLVWSAGFLGVMLFARQELVSLMAGLLTVDGHITLVGQALLTAYLTGAVTLLIPWILYRTRATVGLHVNPHMAALACGLMSSHATLYLLAPPEWKDEEALLEWVAACITLVAIVLFLASAKRVATGYALAAVWGLFLLEELNWGQTLLGLESPAVFAEHNRQGETNLHNFIPLYVAYYAAFHAVLFSGLTWARSFGSVRSLLEKARLGPYLWLSDRHSLWIFPLPMIAAVSIPRLGPEFVEEQWAIFGVVNGILLYRSHRCGRLPRLAP